VYFLDAITRSTEWLRGRASHTGYKVG
jgi:hypothetical protein